MLYEYLLMLVILKFEEHAAGAVDLLHLFTAVLELTLDLLGVCQADDHLPFQLEQLLLQCGNGLCSLSGATVTRGVGFYF